MKFAGIHALAGIGLAAPAESKLPSATIGVENAKLSRQPFGDLRIYFAGATDQVKSITTGSVLLKPGMTPHPPHQHPEEELMVFVQGTGEVSIDGKVTKVAPGSMMFAAGGRLHGIVNTGEIPLLFYFCRWLG